MNKLEIQKVILDYIIDDFKNVSWEKEGNEVK